MDWSDERYVRLYTRDTADWVSWPWQARALLPLLMRKADRKGELEMGRGGTKTLAILVMLPEAVVKPGLAALLRDGCVGQDGRKLLIVNFTPAQEAAKSDVVRQREHRERQRSIALESLKVANGTVTPVTVVTNGIENVTPTSALAEPSVPTDPQLTLVPPAAAVVGDDDRAFALWNELTTPPIRKATSLTPKRRKKIKAALKLVALSDWPAAIQNVNAWPWALGRNPSNWKADLDWFLGADRNGADNIVRAFEGNLSSGVNLDKGRVPAENQKHGTGVQKW